MADRRLSGIEEKDALRQALRHKRALADRARTAERLADLFDKHLSLSPEAVVAGYCAVGDEMDPRPLMERLAQRGHRLCLPCGTRAGSPLLFRSYQLTDKLRSSQWLIPEPMPDASLVEPDVLLVPLLGFDRRGYRLGQGGGYYDRTLAALRARGTCLAVGLAYSLQEVDALPIAPHDAKLDAVVTEEHFILFS